MTSGLSRCRHRNACSQEIFFEIAIYFETTRRVGMACCRAVGGRHRANSRAYGIYGGPRWTGKNARSSAGGETTFALFGASGASSFGEH